MTVNDTTNSLTTRIIFGTNRKPQSEFHYRNLAEPVESLDKESMDFLKKACPKMMEEPHYGWKYNDKDEVPFEAHSILPYFPGYVFDHGNPHIVERKWARADLLRAFRECMEM